MSDVIFVIGSKPQAIFPDVTPTKIYAANGAIARAQEIAQKYDVPLTGVLFRRFLSAQEKERASPTAIALNGCRGDRLIISGGGPKHGRFDTPRARGLQFGSEERLSRSRSLLLKMRYASVLRIGRDILNLIVKAGWSETFAKVRKTRSLGALGISTGMLAVLLALRESGRSSRVYVIGIGIDVEEGQFYDPNSAGRFRHVDADKAMVRDLVRKIPRDKLIFTDPKFAAFSEASRSRNAVQDS